MTDSWLIITMTLARYRRGLMTQDDLVAWIEERLDVMQGLRINPAMYRRQDAAWCAVKDLRAALTRHDLDPLITQYHALDAASWEYSRQRTGWRERLVAATLGGDDFAPLDKVRWLWRCDEDEDSAGHWAAGARMAALNKHWNGQVPHNARRR